MSMLEAMHARMPQMAPMMPGRPPAKPIIEKTELWHTDTRAVRSVTRDVAMHVQRCGGLEIECCCGGAPVQITKTGCGYP